MTTYGVASNPDLSKPAGPQPGRAGDAPSTPSAPPAEPPDAPEPSEAGPRHAARRSIMDRLEAGIARLSARSNFWQRVSSMIWLPYAFRSGIKMKRVDDRTFAAVLPFRRFNRNWYNAMAGAALLGNSEIAGGMYVFGIAGGDYTIVCKELTYKFLRPCFGPALYKITPREDIKSLVAQNKEFNATIDMEIVQQGVLPKSWGRKKPKDSMISRLAAKDRRVGRCTAIFHVTPHLHQKAKRGSVRQVG
ncbi:MAG: hypothetical protein IT436_18875 [Phycisphaerales bacterium]|nr:hypothetical protein [Phycisphaerales bacterium]